VFGGKISKAACIKHNKIKCILGQPAVNECVFGPVENIYLCIAILDKGDMINNIQMIGFTHQHIEIGLAYPAAHGKLIIIAFGCDNTFFGTELGGRNIIASGRFHYSG